jgi:hypothetical protein
MLGGGNLWIRSDISRILSVILSVLVPCQRLRFLLPILRPRRHLPKECTTHIRMSHPRQSQKEQHKHSAHSQRPSPSPLNPLQHHASQLGRRPPRRHRHRLQISRHCLRISRPVARSLSCVRSVRRRVFAQGSQPKVDCRLLQGTSFVRRYVCCGTSHRGMS